MSAFCEHCGVCSRNPCSNYKGRNRFDGCYNLTRERQLQELGDPESLELLELLRENAELRGRQCGISNRKKENDRGCKQ